jgi:hypothetical protein
MVNRLKRNFQGGGMDASTWGTTSTTPVTSTRSSRGHGVVSSRPPRVGAVTGGKPDGQGKGNRVPNLNTPYNADEFGGWEGSEAAILAEEAAALQAEKDKKAKIDLAKRLQEQREERERTGTTYKPGERKIDKSGMAYYESTLLPSGLTDDPDNDYETWTYGEFGYGPNAAMMEEMWKAGYMSDSDYYNWKAGKGPGASWADFAEYGYGTNQYGITDEMFLGGKPGQIGYGPGKKPVWYGEPKKTAGTTGGGQNDQGGYSYGYGGQGGSEGSVYGYEGEEDPLERGYKRARFGPGDLMERVNQNLLRLAGLRKKRGGIVSLLRLSR